MIELDHVYFFFYFCHSLCDSYMYISYTYISGLYIYIYICIFSVKFNLILTNLVNLKIPSNLTLKFFFIN